MSTSVDSIIDVSFVALQVNLLEEAKQKREFVTRSKAEVEFEPRVGLIASDLTGAIAGRDRFVFERERIDIELKPDERRSVITRRFPESLDDLRRFSEIVNLALSIGNLSGSKLGPAIGYGYNIELVFSQDTHDSALAYLAEKTTDPKLSERIGAEVLGATTAIYLADGRRMWTVRLEPRYADEEGLKIFMSITYHIAHPDDTFPKEIEEVQSALKTLWDRAHSIVGDIDA